MSLINDSYDAPSALLITRDFDLGRCPRLSHIAPLALPKSTDAVVHPRRA